MINRRSIRLSQSTLARVTFIGAVLLMLPVIIFTMRQQRNVLSMPPSQMGAEPVFREERDHTRSKVEEICFMRGAWIYLVNLATGTETRIIEGVGAHIAPTGGWLAFISATASEGITNSVFPPPGRLRLLNLQTKEIRDFRALRDSRTGDPIWSNDGTRIAVVVASTDSKQPSIAVLDAGTGDLEKKITGGWDLLTPDEGIYLSSWTPDDRSILFHSLGALYEVRLDSGLVQKIPVDELFETGGISSSTQFSFSPDRRYLLFDRMIDTPDEPGIEVVSVFDLTAKTFRRVTPKTVQGRAPVWLPSNDEILFTRVEWSKGKWRTSICKMALDGTGLTTVAHDADFVSYALR